MSGFQDDKWDAEINVNKLSERSHKPASRTIKSRIEYTAGSAHALLHRDAAATRKALNHPDVRFDTGDGIKPGTEVADSDLEYGECNVCKALPAVAPTRHAKGFLQFACRDCHGHSALASKRE